MRKGPPSSKGMEEVPGYLFVVGFGLWAVFSGNGWIIAVVLGLKLISGVIMSIKVDKKKRRRH